MSVTQTLKMFSNWTDESETKAIVLMGANEDGKKPECHCLCEQHIYVFTGKVILVI